MKKAKPGLDGLEAVETYLAAVPEPAHTTLQKLRKTIRAAAPAEATECISYGMPAFRYKGALVGYAAFSKHCSLFPMSVAVIEAHAEELGDMRTSKGTLQFPMNKPPSAALVKKIVKARVAENEARKNR